MEEVEKVMKSIDRRRALNRAARARYRKKHPEKIAEQRKRFRERHRAKLREANRKYREENRTKVNQASRIYQKRYREKNRERMREYGRQYYWNRREYINQYYRQYYRDHRESILMRQEQYRQHYEPWKTPARQFMVEYQEKRDKTFGMTLQRQLDYFHSEKKRTEEKLKGSGPQKLMVTLTDCLKSPPPPPTMDQSLNEDEENVSFMDLLNGPTMLNLDSHQISTMDKHVCDEDANQWLDELMADLEEPPPMDSCVCDWLDDLIGDLEDPSSLETTVDVHDLLHDVENKIDWEHVVDDVIDHFDCGLLS